MTIPPQIRPIKVEHFRLFFFSFFVLLLLLPSYNLAQNVSSCFTGENSTSTNYPSISSLLHVFTWMKAPCSGTIESVTFINHFYSDTASYFNLGVFEPIANRNGSFRIRHHRRISVTRDHAPKTWQTSELPPASPNANP